MSAVELDGGKRLWQSPAFFATAFDVGEKYVSVCQDGPVLEVFNVETGGPAGAIAGYDLTDKATCLVSDPGDKWAFVGTRSGHVVRMKANTDWKAFDSENGTVTAIARDAKCKKIAIAGEGGTVRWMDAKGKFDKKTIGEPGGAKIVSLAIAPKGGYLAAGTEGGEVVVWKGTSEEARLETGGEALAVAFDPKAAWLAATTSTGELHVWRTKGFERVAKQAGSSGEALRALAFVDKGAAVVVADGKDVRRFDLSGL